MDATGIEMSAVRYLASCKALTKLPEHPVRGEGNMGVRFLLANVQNVDFTDADVVFANSVLMNNETKQYIIDTARGMKNGSRLVVYNGTQVKGPGFREGGLLRVPTTWFPFVDYSIYIVHRHELVEQGTKPTECTQEGQCPSNFQGVEKTSSHGAK